MLLTYSEENEGLEDESYWSKVNEGPVVAMIAAVALVETRAWPPRGELHGY
jgi:uncharacterized membrane protein